MPADQWNVRTTVEGAPDLKQVARRLGMACLDNQRTLSHRRGTAAMERRRALTNALCHLPAEAFADGAVLAEALSGGEVDEHRDAIEQLYPWVAHVAVLRALCMRALLPWFDAQEETVQLERGDPFPVCALPIKGLPVLLTPHPKQADLGQDLEGTYCRIHTEDTVSVILDFRRAKDLDHVICPDGRFATAATIHPYAPDGLAGPTEVVPVEDVPRQESIGDAAVGTFFGIGPASWRPGDIGTALRRAADRGASVTVLPEASLPHPDALQERLSDDAMPRLVVAGSAHSTGAGRGEEEGTPVRINESVAYLDAEELVRHRKIRPFQSRRIGTRTYRAERREDISTAGPELRIACGAHVRLAVLICSDLNDPHLEILCTHLGVNVLLVPSLTPHLGTFSTTVSSIASRNQGIAIVANGTLPEPEEEGVDGDAEATSPFMTLVGVPRSESVMHQIADGQAPAAVRQAIALIDPNAPASQSTTWYSLAGAPLGDITPS